MKVPLKLKKNMVIIDTVDGEIMRIVSPRVYKDGLWDCIKVEILKEVPPFCKGKMIRSRGEVISTSMRVIRGCKIVPKIKAELLK